MTLDSSRDSDAFATIHNNLLLPRALPSAHYHLPFGVLDPCVTATNRVPWRFTGKESEVAPGFRDLTVTLLKTSLTDNDLAVQLEGIASSARVAETSIGFSPTTLKSAT